MAERKDESRGWPDRRLWEIQPVRDVLLIAGVLALVWLGRVVSVVTVPLLLALALAYLFEPLIRRATRTKWISRKGAAAGLIVGVLALVVVPAILGATFAAAQGFAYAERLAANVALLGRAADEPQNPALRDELPSDFWREVLDYYVEQKAIAQREAQPDAGAPPPADGDDGDEPAVRPLAFRVLDGAVEFLEANRDTISKRVLATAGNALTSLGRAVLGIGLLAFTAFLTAFFFFFVSTGWGRVLAFWESLIPEKRRGRTLDLVQKMDRVIAGFVRGRLVIAAIQSVVFTAGYWAIGVPVPMVIGPLVAILAIVPYLALIGIPISVLLLLLEPSGEGLRATWWWAIGAPVGVYFLGQALDDYVWTPLLQGKNTGMDTPTILFASLAGGALAGVYGLLLAIPVAACLKILLQEIVWPRFREWTKGKSSDPLPLGGSRQKP